MFNHLLSIIQYNSWPGLISFPVQNDKFPFFHADCPVSLPVLFKRLRLCVTCAECKNTLDRISQQTSIHAYDCFVCWKDFKVHRGWDVRRDLSFRNGLLLCQHRTGVISSSSWKIDGVRWVSVRAQSGDWTTEIQYLWGGKKLKKLQQIGAITHVTLKGGRFCV